MTGYWAAQRGFTVATWGYVLVSPDEPDPSVQVQALRAAGIPARRIVTEHLDLAQPTGRPQLQELLNSLRAKDALVVWRLDRLGRSLGHLVRLVEDLAQRGVHVRSLTEGLDTAGDDGATAAAFTTLAGFDRSLAQSRATLAAAKRKAKGHSLGRTFEVSVEQWRLVHQMHRAGGTQHAIARVAQLPRSTVGRVLRREIASLEKRVAGLDIDDGGLPFYSAEP